MSVSNQRPDLLFFLPRPRHPQLPKDGLHLRWRWGWFRGQVRRPYWWLRSLCFGTRLEIGKRFSLQGSLIARGPGRVILGDDCIVGDRCTPFTHSRQATITIGSRVYLNGTRFGCSQSIEVGDDCILADARIFDTDFHSVHRARNTLASPPPGNGPVKIGPNVWVAAGAAILKGATIGADSVIGFGAIVSSDVPGGRIYVGNPAKDSGPVP